MVCLHASDDTECPPLELDKERLKGLRGRTNEEAARGRTGRVLRLFVPGAADRKEKTTGETRGDRQIQIAGRMRAPPDADAEEGSAFRRHNRDIEDSVAVQIAGGSAATLQSRLLQNSREVFRVGAPRRSDQTEEKQGKKREVA